MLLLVATWLVAQEAHADAVAPLDLTWSAPASCPSHADVESSVARLLAGSRSGETLGADVKVTVDRHGLYHARLRTHLRDADGERSLTAASCPLVASATALVLALTIDPTLAVEPQESEPSPPPPASPPPAPPALSAPREESVAPAPAATRESSSLTVAPGAAALVDVGSLPSPAIGGAVEIAVDKGWASLRAEGAAFGAQHVDAGSRAGAGGRFTLLAASLRGCAGAGALWRVEGCVGIELDRIVGEGFGVSSPGSATRVSAGARAGVRLAFRPAPLLSVPVALDAIVPLNRPTFVLGNVGTVFRPAPVAIRASIGLVVHFE
jgi:hypothetical protein